MKLTVNPKPFAGALGHLAKIAATKGTLPICSSVLVMAEDGRLVLTATDAAIALELAIPADVSERGSVALPAKILSEWAALAEPSEPIALAVDGKHKATLTSARATTKLSGLASGDFPPLPSMEGGRTLDLDATALKTGLGRVLHAVADDDSRPVLHCVLFAAKDETLTLTAADGFRLAACPIALPEPMGEPLKLLVPKGAAAELERSLPDDGLFAFAVAANGNRALASWDGARLALPLGSGEFPDWRRLVPAEPTTTATIDRAALDRALRLAKLVIGGTMEANGRNVSNMAISLVMEPGEPLVVRSRGADGSHEAALSAEVEGAPLDFGCNWQYLREMLTACGTERVCLRFTGEMAPALIFPEPDDGFIGVVMAMHIAAAEKAAA